MILRTLLTIFTVILYIAILGTGFTVMLETQPERFFFLIDIFSTIGAATIAAVCFTSISVRA